ncbi:MAG: hypothetical protein ACLPHI_00765 [Terriglobales bacterium]
MNRTLLNWLVKLRSANGFGIACVMLLQCLPVFGQAVMSGSATISGSSQWGSMANAPQMFFAALPLNWVDNTICNPPGGVYDTTVILGTTINTGPNAAGEAIGSPYALTPAGLEDAMGNWRDNADNASQTPHFADAWWLVEVPAGTVLEGNNFDSNNALISLPGKGNGGEEPAKCLVIDSTTPLPAGQMACGRGLPGFGGARNPGCALPNDKASMWKVQLDAPLPTNGKAGVYAGPDLANPSFCPQSPVSGQPLCWTNHVVVRDVEITVQPGAAQSGIVPSKAFYGFKADPNLYGSNPCSVATPCIAPDSIGLDRYYIHGWDPGDPGQPVPGTASITNVSSNGTAAVYTASNSFTPNILVNVAGLTGGNAVLNCVGCVVLSAGLSSSQFELANVNAVSSNAVAGVAATQAPSGACWAWTNTGTVTTAVSGSNTVVTWAGGSYFGMTFAAGSTVYIDGVAQTILDDGTLAEGLQNGAQDTQFVISGTSLSPGTYPYTQSNPPSKNSAGQFSFVYGAGVPVQGCGDDVVDGVVFETDYGWRQNGYIEKIHWWASEPHASLQGFSKGPYKDVNNWEETSGGGSWFNGGGPVDQNGGPENDDEVRRNFLAKDLNARYLTGVSGNSPGPPWGCGPISAGSPHNTSAQSTCPFRWAVKNSVELKLGSRVLFDGNIIDGSWADGQTGWCVVTAPRTCSGGESCGIYDPVSGLPLTYIDNVRFSNNWIRNCPSMATTGGSSDIGPGDGGGISLPATNDDYINNLGTNINDTNQQGNPNYQWPWGGGANKYPCNMSYTGNGVPNGSTAPFVVKAVCTPIQIDATAKMTKVATDGAGHVEIFEPLRLDPILCPAGNWNSSTTYSFGTIVSYSSILYQSLLPNNTGNVPSTSLTYWSPGANCAAAGQTLIINNTADIPSGWPGTYTMGGTTYPGGSNFQTQDGTGGTGTGVSPVITTNEIAEIGANATLCDNSGTPKCSSLLDQGSNTDITFASQGSRILDIGPGNGIYAYDCSATGYAAGVGSGPPQVNAYAIAPTSPASLTVYYQVPSQPANTSATCTLNNVAGFPEKLTVQNNTFFSPNTFAIQADFNTQLFIDNWFFNNVFVDNDTNLTSDLFCNVGNNQEGIGSTPLKSSFACWDPNTLEFYNNVLTGRNPTYWGVADPLSLCPGCSNYFPQSGLAGTGANTGVNCSDPQVATSGCLGYAGFMGSTPAVSFPSGPCSASNAPFNCPLMALPWANNFTDTDVSYVGSSSYSTEGVNTDQLNNAMTQTRYVCPRGANCGTTGPYPD